MTIYLRVFLKFAVIFFTNDESTFREARSDNGPEWFQKKFPTYPYFRNRPAVTQRKSFSRVSISVQRPAYIFAYPTIFASRESDRRHVSNMYVSFQSARATHKNAKS